MAMAKNNGQLAMELNALSNRVQGLADRLENMMPEVKNKILDSEAATQEISKNLQSLVNPLLQADLVSRTQIINDKMDVLNGSLADISSNLKRQQQALDNMSNIFSHEMKANSNNHAHLPNHGHAMWFFIYIMHGRMFGANLVQI